VQELGDVQITVEKNRLSSYYATKKKTENDNTVHTMFCTSLPRDKMLCPWSKCPLTLCLWFPIPIFFCPPDETSLTDVSRLLHPLGGGGGGRHHVGRGLVRNVEAGGWAYWIRSLCRIYMSWAHRLNMELYLQSLFGLLCTAVLIGWDPATTPSSRIWAHIRGSYWSDKINDISL
jgi:hypothetical protein